jgi:hypothetical protein
LKERIPKIKVNFAAKKENILGKLKKCEVLAEKRAIGCFDNRDYGYRCRKKNSRKQNDRIG